MLEQTIVTITTLPNETIYVLLLVNAFIEYFFPPFPGDTIMVFGAYLSGTGKLNLSVVYLVSLVGSVSRFLALFSLGKHYGREFFLKRNFRFLSRGLILKVVLWFQRYGIGLIIANRFFSGIRSAIALFAGTQYEIPDHNTCRSFGLPDMEYPPYIQRLLFGAKLAAGSRLLGKPRPRWTFCLAAGTPSGRPERKSGGGRLGLCR